MGWLRCVTLLLLPVWFPHGPPKLEALGWCHFDLTWLTGVSNPRPILALVSRALWMPNIGSRSLILGIFIGGSYKIALSAICHAQAASIGFSIHFDCHRASENHPKSYVWTDANVSDAVLRSTWHIFGSKTLFWSSLGGHNKTNWHSFFAYLEEQNSSEVAGDFCLSKITFKKQRVKIFYVNGKKILTRVSKSSKTTIYSFGRALRAAKLLDNTCSAYLKALRAATNLKSGIVYI